MDNNLCLECGERIASTKRSDAKFCSETCGNKARNRRHSKKNPEKILENRRRQNMKAERRILTRIRHRAKKDNIPFNLEVEDIIIPEYCPVLGLKIEELGRSGGGGWNRNNAPSVDRINPSKGYIQGNVRVISNRANLLKSNATIEELELVLKNLKEIGK